jgi:predicted ATPase
MNNTKKHGFRFTRLKLENWRNFTSVELELPRRVFLVGPNESGKSNFLDAFRFLHDVAMAEGGFRQAMSKRGGAGRLKSLAGKHHAAVGIQVCVGNDKSKRRWEYALSFRPDDYYGKITEERVLAEGKKVLTRPDKEDEKDSQRLSQTHAEQVSRNQKFRQLAGFFASVRYAQLVPQVLRRLVYPSTITDDPYGGSLLQKIGGLPEGERAKRMGIIRNALRAAVPQLQDLQFWQDDSKNPHLRAKYEHQQGTWQLEDQLSDGTLRLIGLVWEFQEGTGPLLLEEPELFLHPAVVRYLPQMFARLQALTGRQVLVSTHSPELLRDEGIGLHEVFLLQPGPEGTVVRPAGDFEEIRTLVDSGLALEEAVLPKTSPTTAHGIALVKE